MKKGEEMPPVQTARQDICERTMNYSLRIVDLFNHLQQSSNRAAWVISNQLLRSATSVGANIEEAQAGESRHDFAHKCAIALKEARESLYWLRLTQFAGFISAKRIDPLIQETREIVAVLTSIVKKSKRPLIPTLVTAMLHLLF
jgi:four helix bundle protein